MIHETKTVVPSVLPEQSGLRYQRDEGTWSVYVMEIGGRPVFEVSVDNTDADLVIWVGKVGARWAAVEDVSSMAAETGPSQATNGRAKRNDVGRISGYSVQTYVYSRVARIMADLFVPVR